MAMDDMISSQLLFSYYSATTQLRETGMNKNRQPPPQQAYSSPLPEILTPLPYPVSRILFK